MHYITCIYSLSTFQYHWFLATTISVLYVDVAVLICVAKVLTVRSRLLLLLGYLLAMVKAYQFHRYSKRREGIKPLLHSAAPQNVACYINYVRPLLAIFYQCTE